MQAEFINSLADAVAAEHFHISFIVEFGADIPRSFTADVVTCNGVHDDFHGGVRSCVYQEIQSYVGVTFLFHDFFLRLLVFGHQHDGILKYAVRCLVYEAYELVAHCRGDTFFHISEVGVAVGGHCHVDIHPVCRIAGNGGVACAIHRAVEGEVG